MASHTRKRQYQPSSQPSITSYFGRTSSASNERTLYTTSPSLSPPVPEQVQQNLLSVGMRVRKSVPEGYKTHKTLPPAPARTIYTPAVNALPPPPPSSAPAGYSRTRELAPFCGLDMVGGFGVQSQRDYRSSNDLRDERAVPGLSYSQSSLASLTSTAGPPENSRKRSYDEEIEDDLDAYFDEVEDQPAVAGAERGGSSKFSGGYAHLTNFNPTATSVRPMARPKGRMRVAAASRGSIVNSDFDDHDVGFLQPMDMELDG